MLTTEQIEKYVKGGGAECPVCGSADLCADSVYWDKTGGYQQVNCPDCDLEWTDEYTLTGITQED